MGTKVAPSLANIVMADFEEKYVYTYHKQPLFWKHFLSDYVMVWTHGWDELHKFEKHLNSMHPTLKFTMEASQEKINFLDTTLHINKEGELWTEVYCKPTDSHSYLYYSSAHPPHCKRSLPYSQLLRLKRICSKRQDSMKNAHSLCVYFLHRGYPVKLILDALLKSSLKSREDLIKIS